MVPIINTLSFILSHPINRHRKIAAILEWFLWQLRSLSTRGTLVMPFVNDSRLLVCRRMRGATGNIYVGLHEFNEMSFLLHYLRQGDLFIDVGANVGTYTVLAAKVCGARCIAFEPDNEAFRNLVANLKFNNISNLVTVHQIAISDHAGLAFFTAGLGPENRVIPEPFQTDATVQVNADTLDHILCNVRPTLMKIDVEGHQGQVISGALNIFKNQSPNAVILEMTSETSGWASSESLHQFMRTQGFSAVNYSPFDRILSILNYQPPDRNYHNILYIKSIDEAQNRVNTAPKFRVKNMEI